MKACYATIAQAAGSLADVHFVVLKRALNHCLSFRETFAIKDY
jgi:hypothetical protein